MSPVTFGRYPRWLFLALGMLLVTAAISCGDDDDDANGGRNDLSLSEYFLNVEEIQQDYQLDARDLQIELESVNQDDADVALEALRNYYEDSQTAFARAIDQVDALDPPDEAQDAHTSFVEAGRVVAAETTAVLAGLQDAETLDEANALLEATSEADAAADEFNAACRDLQAIADREGIAAGLGCAPE